MSLILSACLSEDCDGIEYIDNTRLYSVTNTGGYGVQNDITGPSDFDSYTLYLWAPSADPATADPTYTLDLQTDVPPIDSDEDYVWTFTLADLNATSLESGYWYMRALGVKDGVNYEVNSFNLFVSSLRSLVDQAISEAKIDCACKQGCVDPFRLYTLLDVISPRCGCGCSNVCSMDKVKTIVKYLYTNLPNCCC